MQIDIKNHTIDSLSPYPLVLRSTVQILISPSVQKQDGMMVTRAREGVGKWRMLAKTHRFTRQGEYILKI